MTVWIVGGLLLLIFGLPMALMFLAMAVDIITDVIFGYDSSRVVRDWWNKKSARKAEIRQTRHEAKLAKIMASGKATPFQKLDATVARIEREGK